MRITPVITSVQNEDLAKFLLNAARDIDRGSFTHNLSPLNKLKRYLGGVHNALTDMNQALEKLQEGAGVHSVKLVDVPAGEALGEENLSPEKLQACIKSTNGMIQKMTDAVDEIGKASECTRYKKSLENARNELKTLKSLRIDSKKDLDEVVEQTHKTLHSLNVAIRHLGSEIGFEVDPKCANGSRLDETA